jgi:hypothetical protein
MAVLSRASDGGMTADSAVPCPAKPHHTSLCAAAFSSPAAYPYEARRLPVLSPPLMPKGAPLPVALLPRADAWVG